jgi:ABC-type lipoprotein release transport system permease subunit
MATNQILASRMQGVKPLDPWAYAGVFVLMLATGTAACLAPAFRASKVDPLEAIRCE